MHAPYDTPAKWIVRHTGGIHPGGDVLDLACGGGRNGRFCLRNGHSVTFVDRDISRIADLASNPAATIIEADLENEPWPLGDRTFDVVIVCNYLHRPLLPRIAESVAAGGLLLYDTFAVGNERFGQPRNPAFLLRPGELPQLLGDAFIIHAYWHGLVNTPRPAMRQSICATRKQTSR